MKGYLLALLGLCLAWSSQATDVDTVDLKDAELMMKGLVLEVLQNKNLEVRQDASNQLATLLEKALNQKGSFEYPFDKVQGVSILTTDDQAVRIFTWQLYIDKDHYQYLGFIQTKDGKVYPLKDKSDDMRTVEFSSFKPSYWYGALYYHQETFKHDGKPAYLLFGYDAYDFYNRRKLLDVLYFDASGRPRFGKTVLEMKDGRGQMRQVKRFVMEYSASVNVTLNYDDEAGMVVFDHLIYGSPIKSAGPTNVPDGSYCGLKLTKNGTWVYVDKVHKDDPNNVLIDATSYQTMIVNGQKEKKKKEDIFGRKKKP